MNQPRWGGRGPGRGRGGATAGGRGWRHWFNATGIPGWARRAWGAPPSNENEQQWLEEQARVLEDELREIRTRLSRHATHDSETE